MVCWNVPGDRSMVCCKTEVYSVLRCHVNGGICSRVRWIRTCVWKDSPNWLLTVGWVTGTVRIFYLKREQAGFYMLISTVCLTRYSALYATWDRCWLPQGLTFDKPELVPFRLTHNMTDAFGAYGYNGTTLDCNRCRLPLNVVDG